MSEKIKRQIKRVYSWKMILGLAVIIAATSISLVMADFNTGDTIVDYTMGNVGIGNTNPISKLEVNGCIRSMGYESIPSSGVGLEIYYNNVNSTGILFAYDRSSHLNKNLQIGVDNKQIYIRSDGYIGIGTSSPQQKLDVAGTTTSTNYACSSDARWKKNINPYHNALDKVLGLKGVSYFWKSEEYKDKNFSKEKQIGFLAQDVEKIIPELVMTDSKGYKSMSYDKLTVVIVEAIKELKAKNDQKLSAIVKENSELKARIATLEKMNERVAKLERMINAKERLIGMK